MKNIILIETGLDDECEYDVIKISKETKYYTNYKSIKTCLEQIVDVCKQAQECYGLNYSSVLNYYIDNFGILIFDSNDIIKTFKLRSKLRGHKVTRELNGYQYSFFELEIFDEDINIEPFKKIICDINDILLKSEEKNRINKEISEKQDIIQKKLTPILDNIVSDNGSTIDSLKYDAILKIIDDDSDKYKLTGILVGFLYNDSLGIKIPYILPKYMNIFSYTSKDDAISKYEQYAKKLIDKYSFPLEVKIRYMDFENLRDDDAITIVMEGNPIIN